MRIIKNIDEFSKEKNPVVTVGSFDGVHLGHRAIIQRTITLAKETGGASVAVTFSPHPQTILRPEHNDFFYLTTPDEKYRLLNFLGIDILIEIPFTKEFAAISFGHFIRSFISEKLNAKWLVIGYDHHFGNNRMGTISELVMLRKQYGFQVEEVNAQFVNGAAVSSTKIRNALLAGNVGLADSFLGHPYFFSGSVISGNGIGKQIGFPTANIEPAEKNKMIPADGAYAVMLEVEEKEYKGMLNIGIRPTISGTSRVIEAHLFDFDENIYEKNVTVHFIERVRDEVKFSNINELRKQLQKDKEASLKILLKKMSL